MSGVRLQAAVTLVGVWASAAAVGHPIVIHAGSVEWTGDTVRVTLELDQHAFEHEAMAVRGELTRRQVAEALVRGIHLTTHTRQPVTAGAITVAEDGSRATCAYGIPSATTAVALTHRPGEELSAMMRQFQFAWFPADAPHQTVLRLTSGGNHAVIRRDRLDLPPAAIEDPFVTPVFRVVVDRDERARVEIDYPITLAATWTDLAQVRDEAITGESFRRNQAAIARWAIGRLSSTGGDASPPTFAVERVDLIGPCEEVLTEADGGLYSIYTTRLRIGVTIAAANAAAGTDLAWSGFNAAILCVPVEWRTEDEATLVGILTPEQPTVRLMPGHPLAVEIRPATKKDP